MDQLAVDNSEIMSSFPYICEFCKTTDELNSFRIIVNVHVVGPLCVIGLVGNCLSFTALGLDKTLGYSAALLLRAMAVSDNVYLLACLLAQTLKTIGYATDWVPRLVLLYPQYIERYVWPVASTAQTTTVWLLTIVTVMRYYAVWRPLNVARFDKSLMKRIVATTVALAVLFNLPRSVRLLLLSKGYVQ